MAKGKKTGGKNFVIGDPRAGRPAMPADLKRANALTQAELKRILNQYLFMDDRELSLALQEPMISQLEKIVGKIIMVATTDGDTQRLDFLLNRLIGKVTEKMEVKLPQPFIVRRADGSTVEMGAKVEDEE